MQLDAQVGDAGSLALARLHGEEERAAVVLDGAQLVEFRVETVRDDAAFAHDRRGFLLQARCEIRLDVVRGG